MSKKDTEYLINRKDNQYEVVIGLEVHAQVLSDSKLFSTCVSLCFPKTVGHTKGISHHRLFG